MDLIALGVGGTVGSGIFVLCGQIAHGYAGTYTYLSWIGAGVAATTSALSLCELASAIPDTGSTYAYCRAVHLGGSQYTTTVALLAAACLTLEYAVSGAAVARTWGDKLVWYLSSTVQMSDASRQEDQEEEWNTTNNQDDDGIQTHSTVWSDWLLPGDGWINIPAGLISLWAMALLVWGVQESKQVTNLITGLKLLLIAGLVVGGFTLFQGAAWRSTPPPHGVTGIVRGTTSAFFGYLGYDEVCVVAGEAVNPRRNVPRAILATLAIVTLCSVGASMALTGMVPHPADVSPTAGFPAAFALRNRPVWSQLAALGELGTLPVVVLVSLLAQPRLSQRMADDGLLPAAWFGRTGRTATANPLRRATWIWGLVMTSIATAVPFTYLDDLISCGILVAFCLANASLLVLRQDQQQQQQQRQQVQPQEELEAHEPPQEQPPQEQDGYAPPSHPKHNHNNTHTMSLQRNILCFNLLCASTSLLLSRSSSSHHDPTNDMKNPDTTTTTTTTPWWNQGLVLLLTLATVVCYGWGIVPYFTTNNKPPPSRTTITTTTRQPPFPPPSPQWWQWWTYCWNPLLWGANGTTYHPAKTRTTVRRHSYTAVQPSIPTTTTTNRMAVQAPFVDQHPNPHATSSTDPHHHRGGGGPRTTPLEPHVSPNDDDDRSPWNHHDDHHHHHLSMDHDADDNDDDTDPSSYFRTPCVPWIPCLAMVINWYLIAQLEIQGLLLLVLYLAGTVALFRFLVPQHARTTTVRPPLQPEPQHPPLQYSYSDHHGGGGSLAAPVPPDGTPTVQQHGPYNESILDDHDTLYDSHGKLLTRQYSLPVRSSSSNTSHYPHQHHGEEPPPPRTRSS